MQLCVVCVEQIPKYRCPACRIRYCSLVCFKKHKSDDSCQPVKDSAPSAPAPCPGSCQSGAAEPWTVDDLLDEDSQSDRVPLQKLQQLGLRNSRVDKEVSSYTDRTVYVVDGSKDLRTLLQNPHLRNLMLSVDSAENKSKAMQKAMQEPLFVELANQCLQIIEPTETPNNGDDDDDDDD